MGWWCKFGGHAFHGHHRHGRHGHGDDAGAPALGDKLLLALVLEALEAKPGSGYDVVSALEPRLEVVWGFGPQQVYPVLRLAEDAGFVTASPVDGKTVYAVTEAGHVQLAERRKALEAFWARVEEARAQAELGLLFREVKDLACAFREELGADRLDRARIGKLKAAIAQAREALAS